MKNHVGKVQGLSDWAEIPAVAVNQSQLTDEGASSGAGAAGQPSGVAKDIDVIIIVIIPFARHWI